MSAQKKMREAAFAAGTSASSTDGLAKVTLKVENAVNPKWGGSVVTEVLVPPGTSVYNMLLQAAKDDNKLKSFKANWDARYWSHFIYSINGLAQGDDGYWSYKGRDHDGKEYTFDRGVDLISVFNGDTIIFRYVK